MTRRQAEGSDETLLLKRQSALPALFNIQYPNCRRGMYSLRTPFKEQETREKQQPPDIYTPPRPTPPVLHPEYLHVDRSKCSSARRCLMTFLFSELLEPQEERHSPYRPLQQDAEVQCSLLSPRNVREEIVIRRARSVVRDLSDSDDLSARYRVQLDLRPAQPNIYEVWNVETPPPRSIPLNEPPRPRRDPPPIRIRSSRLVNIQSLSDEDSWDDDDDEEEDGVLYARYLPRNVRMIHVHHGANTIRF